MKKVIMLIIIFSCFIITFTYASVFEVVNQKTFSDLQEAHDYFYNLYGSTTNESLHFMVHDNYNPTSTIIWELSGTSSKTITIEGGTPQPIFSGNQSTLTSGEYGLPVLFVENNVQYLTIQNLHFTDFEGLTHGDGNDNDHRIALTIKGDHNTVYQCQFSDFSGVGPEAAISLSVDDSDNNTVDDCDFYQLGDPAVDPITQGSKYLHAVYINKGDSNTITNNRVHACDAAAFKVKDGANSNTFSSNTIYDCKGDAYFSNQSSLGLNTGNSIIGTTTFGPSSRAYYGKFITSITTNDGTWDTMSDNTWIYRKHSDMDFHDYVIGEDPAYIHFGTGIDDPQINTYIEYNGTFQRYGIIDGINFQFDTQKIEYLYPWPPETIPKEVNARTKYTITEQYSSMKPRTIGPINVFVYNGTSTPDLSKKDREIFYILEDYYLQRWIVKDITHSDHITIEGNDDNEYVNFEITGNYDLSLFNSSGLVRFFGVNNYTVQLFSGETYTLYYENGTGDAKLTIKPTTPAGYQPTLNLSERQIETKKIQIINDYRLNNSYPNPFNPTTNIQYSIPENQKVQLTIYNSLGELVETIVDENQNAGLYNITWDASNQPSGVYFYRLHAGSFFETKKCILMK